jgi:hypothetical protein
VSGDKKLLTLSGMVVETRGLLVMSADCERKAVLAWLERFRLSIEPECSPDWVLRAAIEAIKDGEHLKDEPTGISP